ncbi:MAG: carboxypeptidase-like regulatory domain-containing protein [Balneolaceae bacterium]|nr:carboxypeptidase-like regulatory domain-containing protein [Balneolaceae bacterium]
MRSSRPLTSRDAQVSAKLHLFTLPLLALLALAFAACTSADGPLAAEEDEIAGVVTSTEGPEAGVWVIAETEDLPTRFARIVVTDEQGRYLIPDLPDAEYRVWVRGYGLVDSPQSEASPGTMMDLRAELAPDAQAAAQYYPAGYWYSMINVPEQSEFPGTGPDGNGISPNMQTQAEFLRNIKTGNCTICHQMGNKATRELHPSMQDYESTEAAWERRLQSGQAGGYMTYGLQNMGKEAALEMFADWTDRVEEGAVPPAPPRPEGVERNVVITMWDWADPKSYLHDLVSTDRRDPTLNADGKIYGALEASSDYLPVLDPAAHDTSRVPVTVRDPDTRPASGPNMPAPSPYWGDEPLWDSRANVHNPMFDGQGRVWITATVRPPANPDFCREGSDHPSAQLFPLERAGRHLGVYDPASEEYTHHQHLLQHAPPDVCRGRGEHLVDQRRRIGDRLAEHRRVRPDRRRGGLPGMDGLHPRHERQRRAGRLRGAWRAGRPGAGQEDQRRVLRRGPGPGRHRMGIGPGLPGRHLPSGSPVTIRRRPP